MAQQQLLLLVLAAVVTSVALVAGLGLFRDGAREAEQEQLRLAVARMAEAAQAWYASPAALGGGGGSFLAFAPGLVHVDAGASAVRFHLSHVLPGSLRITGMWHADTTLQFTLQVHPRAIAVVSE